MLTEGCLQVRDGDTAGAARAGRWVGGVGCALLAIATIVGAGCSSDSEPNTDPGTNPGTDAGTGGGDTGAGTDAGTSGSPFAVDCSTKANQTTPHCARPSMVPAGSVGTGPAIPDTGLGTLNGGFVDGNRIIAAFEYAATPAAGVVVAYDLATGNRTIISGTYKDPSAGTKTTGSGPDWGAPKDVQPGPDGWYAVTSLGVYRIDPANGARTQVIDAANTATRCTVGATKAIPRNDTLAIGPDKTVYLSLSNSPAGTGVGAVAVLAGKCTIVSLGGGPAKTDVGSGAAMTSGYFRTLRFHDSQLWALEFQSKSLMTIDPKTGARVRVSSSGTTKVGTGDEDVGSGYLDFAVGKSNPVYTSLYDGANQQIHLASIDSTNGNRSLIPLKSGPANKGGSTYPPLWVHPTSPHLLVGIDNSIVEVDIATGHSYTLSR